MTFSLSRDNRYQPTMETVKDIQLKEIRYRTKCETLLDFSPVSTTSQYANFIVMISKGNRKDHHNVQLYVTQQLFFDETSF